MSELIPDAVTGGPPPSARATEPAAKAEADPRLRDAAEAFESMLVQMLVREMSRAQLEDGFFGTGAGGSIYEGMFERYLSERLAEDSPLGIARVLLERWTAGGEPPEGAGAVLRRVESLRAAEVYQRVAGGVAAAPGTPERSGGRIEPAPPPGVDPDPGIPALLPPAAHPGPGGPAGNPQVPGDPADEMGEPRKDSR